MAPRGLERLGSLADFQAAKDLCLLIPLVVRDDQVDRLFNSFRLAVAEHSLGGLIPADDRAGEILADDRVERRLDNGPKAFFGMFFHEFHC